MAILFRRGGAPPLVVRLSPAGHVGLAMWLHFMYLGLHVGGTTSAELVQIIGVTSKNYEYYIISTFT